jgi:hypothetical protein
MRLALPALLTSCLLVPVSATAQATLHDKFFDSSGVQIRYVEQGKGDVINLHRRGNSYVNAPAMLSLAASIHLRSPH